jgi:hypothetical protein
MSAAASAMMTTHEARVSEITGGGYSLNDLNTAHKSASSLVHHRRKLPPIRSPTSRVPGKYLGVLYWLFFSDLLRNFLLKFT